MNEEDKKEEVLKRLKNIEGKPEKQSQLIKDNQNKQLSVKSVIDVFNSNLSREAKGILYALSNLEKSIDYKSLNFKRDKNLEFDFSKDYRTLRELFKDIYFNEIVEIEKAEPKQDEFNAVRGALEEYIPKKLNAKMKD